jgi:hypothetical protein
MALYLRENLTFSVKENGGTAIAVQSPTKITNNGI